MRVFFTGGGTGGHLYPALAIARALVRLRPVVHPYFIGATRGIEREILPTTEFPFSLLDLHPLYRSAPWNNWRTVAGLTTGWRQVDDLAASERPQLVVATGGYAASAALAFATLRRIPFVIQEQNSFPGKTVALFARWAREVYLGFPEAALPTARDGFGALVALGEDVRVLGIVFESVVWPDRAPPGQVLLRCIFGGGRDPAAAQLDDRALIAQATRDVGVVLGVTGEPAHASVMRWQRGVAQYPVGHREHVRAAVTAGRTHKLALAGADYCGPGINDLCSDTDRVLDEVRAWS